MKPLTEMYINTVVNEEEQKRLGITWQDYEDFTPEERDIIEDHVWDRIADVVESGNSSGEIVIEDDDMNCRGWFDVSIEYGDGVYADDIDEEATDQEVARLIRDGYSSGIDPTFEWSANVWKVDGEEEMDDISDFDDWKIGYTKDWKFGLITREVERIGEDEFVINDTSSGWTQASVTKAELIDLKNGDLDLDELNWE